MKTISSLLCIGFVSFFSYGQDKTELSDPEVASVAVVANQIDISYAQIALKKSKSQEIIDFANTMTKDHKAIIARAIALSEKLGVVPKDNAVSQSLLDAAEKTKKELKKASKNQFDKKYIDNEVVYHKAVIAAVKGLLIPETENVELRELLEVVVPALEAHLGHAEMVQDKVAKG